MATSKYPWETCFHFKARKAFTVKHTQKFKPERIAALSNAWFNWRFHGCVYSRPVQTLLQELDSELPTDITSAVNKILLRSKPRKIEFIKKEESGDKQLESAKKPIINGFLIFEPPENGSARRKVMDSISILQTSAQKSKKSIEYQDLDWKIEDENTKFHSMAVTIDGKLIATGVGATKKLAKHDCADKALDILRKAQPAASDPTVNHKNITKVEKTQLTAEQYRNSKKIDHTNIGNQMLRKMGWTGAGGLGKGGIADPVFLESAKGRKGFGHKTDASKVERNRVEDVLLNFVRDQTETEIKFSNDLSNSDRALVHNLSHKFGLGHKSFGSRKDRYLVVTKKAQGTL
eukprot:gene20100-22070_t